MFRCEKIYQKTVKRLKFCTISPCVSRFFSVSKSSNILAERANIQASAVNKKCNNFCFQRAKMSSINFDYFFSYLFRIFRKHFRYQDRTEH